MSTPGATNFAFASCHYPAGVFDRLPAGASIDRLDQAVESPGVHSLLLLGDQIYADATIGLLDPLDKTDRYHQPYTNWQISLVQRTRLRRLQTNNRFHVTPDDHELVDNWEPGADPTLQTTRDAALEAFEQRRPGASPPPRSGSGYWGAVDVGNGHEVFMLDARTMRSARPWGPGRSNTTAHIVDAPQREALQEWLLERQALDTAASTVLPKFVSSSVWPLPRLAGRVGDDALGSAAAGLSDGWEGYPASLQWLLGLIAERGVCGVVVLCGDAHLAGHTQVHLRTALQPAPIGLNILHAPALYAPFPFANGQPHHYRRSDQFQFGDAAHSVACQVHSDLRPLGDGFVRVEVREADKGLQVLAHIDVAPQTWPVGPLRLA